MQEVSAAIVINRSAEELFTYVINPANTPEWVPSIVAEQTNEWPVGPGSIYRNRRRNGEWSAYTVTAFEPGKLFVLKKKDDGLRVKYVFVPLGKNATRLEYRLCADKGELDTSLGAPLLEELLGRLRSAIERRSGPAEAGRR